MNEFNQNQMKRTQFVGIIVDLDPTRDHVKNSNFVNTTQVCPAKRSRQTTKRGGIKSAGCWLALLCSHIYKLMTFKRHSCLSPTAYQKDVLVDTGAQVSVTAAPDIDTQFDIQVPSLQAANSSIITTYSLRLVSLHFGLRVFQAFLV